MPTRINREKFLQTLQSIAPGVAPREIIEQSTCAIFRKGRVSTFNDEVCCRGPSGLPPELTGAVKAQPIIDMLTKLTEDEITVDQTDGKLTVVGKGQGADFLLEKEIVLPISSVERPTEWTKLPGEFCDAVSLVGSCASTERNSEYDTDCLHVAKGWVECTDRIQACRWTMKTVFPESVHVRQGSIKHIAQLGMTSFNVGQSWVHFKNPAGMVLSCRRYLDVKYPDLEEVLEVKGKTIQLPKKLPEACEKAQVFSKTGELDRVMVEMGRGKMTLSGHGPQGRYWKRFKLAWDGEPISFMTSPDILSELVNKHNDFVISASRLYVKGPSFVYVCSLFTVPEELQNGKAKEAE